MQVKRKTPGAFKTLQLRLAALAKLQGKVGWFESAKYENGTPVAYAAALNELGHGNTPPRPFMRPTANAKEKEWASIAGQMARAVLNGDLTAENAMEQLTTKAESDVFKAISILRTPKLSPVTIELRAMKKANPNLKVTAATVGIAARRVAEPGYQKPEGVSDKPLNDTGRMIATLTHVVEKAK